MSDQTTISTILAAVDDSPASLAAAVLAIGLASALGATIHAVVVTPPTPEPAPEPAAEPAEADRAARALLRYVDGIAGRAGVPLVPIQLAGQAAPRVLEQARVLDADLIVIGRSGRRGLGQPYVGGQTRHVLEFAECPVLVVPPPAPKISAMGGR